jgi:hypothetical protein
VGASSKVEPELRVGGLEEVPAAVAVLSGEGSVEHATGAFLDQFDVRDGSLATCLDEIALIERGDADRLVATLDGVEVDVVAAIDRDGRRAAVVTVPAERSEADVQAVSPLLGEPLDESPAIVWLKDLEGRYLRVNRRYVEQLGTDAEDVSGRTDAELTAAGSIEGLRLEDKDIAGREPLELEYRIGAFEERPAFAALRFALRDADGEATATCSVAAPLDEAAIARSECERLMKIARWGRLDAVAIRQELLDGWGLTLADGSSGPPLDRDERVAAALAERDEALATAARLEKELEQEHEQLGSMRDESERAAKRADELDGAVAAEHARSEELGQSLESAQARAGELENELSGVKAELEEHLVSTERVAAALVERDEALATAARLEKELEQEHEQLGRMRDESERAAKRADELDGAVAAEHARSEELGQALESARARVGELEDELSGVKAELEEYRSTPEAADAPARTTEGEGLEWSAGSQRALAAALVGLTEWRSVLKNATATLGSEGGWDAAIAWCPGAPSGFASMTCGALWIRDPAGLSGLESRVWKHRLDGSSAEFGRARNRMATTCLLELESAEDPLLRAAGEDGMGSALLVPIGSGSETIAMLELLSRTANAPSAELIGSLDAIALQLAAVAALLKLADAPHWRMGRA